jgi:hypothetical protein
LAGASWRYATPTGEVVVESRLPLPGEPVSTVVLVTRGAGLERTEWLADVPPFALAVETQEGAVQEQFAPFAVAGLSGALPVGTELDADYERVDASGRTPTHEHWRVEGRRAWVKVAAGAFPEVLELEREGPMGTVRSYWAEGVGELFEDGPRARELVSYAPPENGAAPVDPAHAAP